MENPPSLIDQLYKWAIFNSYVKLTEGIQWVLITFPIKIWHFGGPTPP